MLSAGVCDQSSMLSNNGGNMDIRRWLIAAAFGVTTIESPAPALGQAVEAQRFGLYVLADDVEQSAAFYEALFQRPPNVRTPALVGFELAGGLFGIVSRGAYAPAEPRGGSVRPYIRVVDLEAAFEHVAHVAPGRIEGGQIVREGTFSFFRFSDPDGNIVELFAVESPRTARP
jgi:predicted enzyme related to lactoylglutathione lyase